VLVTIHRGARQIGGNCVEIAEEGGRILLDLGVPLGAEDPQKVALPPTLNLRAEGKPLLGVLVSRAHQDHYGLWDRLEAEPVPCLVEIPGGSHATLVNFLRFVNLGL
jgi:ribonuclease J